MRSSQAESYARFFKRNHIGSALQVQVPQRRNHTHAIHLRRLLHVQQGLGGEGIGGMQFRALQRELVGSGKMTDREFNDAVLRDNMMPIEMLRALLTRQPLTPHYKASWRFLEPVAKP